MRIAIIAAFLSIMALVILSSRVDLSFIPNTADIDARGLSPNFKSAAPQEATNLLREELPVRLNGGDPNAVDFGQPIQIYGINLSGIETIDPSAKYAVESLISPDSFWEYPMMDSKGQVLGAATLLKSPLRGEWGVSYWGHREKERHFAPQIMEALKELGIPEASEVKRFRIDILGLDFFYIHGSKEQYLVPYEIFAPGFKRDLEDFGSVFLDVESERIYPASEIMALIIDWKTNTGYSIEDGAIGTPGYPRFRKSKVTTTMN